MEITIQATDPTPDDVSVTTYPYEGKPRAQIDIGGIVLYGDPGMLAAVLGQAMRYVLGFGLDARLEIIGAHGNSPEPKRWGIPAWKPVATTVEPEPLSGDYTFLKPGPGFVPSEVADIAMMVPPSTLPGDVVEIGQVGGPTVRIGVQSVSPHPGGGQMVSGTIMGVVEPDDDGSEVYEPGKGWRRAESGEVTTDDLGHGLRRVVETAPFEDEGGPTDA